MADPFSAIFRQVAANMTVVADSDYPQAVSAAVELICDAFTSQRKLLVFGNGGSSADAQHFTAELVGRFVAARRALPAIALTTNQAILTAWSNDYSFDDVFARQGTSRSASLRAAHLRTSSMPWSAHVPAVSGPSA